MQHIQQVGEVKLKKIVKRNFQWNFSTDISGLFFHTKISNKITQNTLLQPKFTEPYKSTPTTSQPKSKNERALRIESSGKRRWEKSNSLDKLLRVSVKPCSR